MKLTLSLYQVAAITAAVSIGIFWMYWKMQKLERQVKELSQQAFQQQRLAAGPKAANDAAAADACCDADGFCHPPSEDASGHPLSGDASGHPPSDSPSGRLHYNTGCGDSVASEDVKDILDRLETSSASSADMERIADSIVAHIERSVKEVDAVATPESVSPGPSNATCDAAATTAAEAFVIGFKTATAPPSEAGTVDTANADPATADLRKKTLDELRAMLKDRGLPTRGNKTELIQRLTAAE